MELQALANIAQILGVLAVLAGFVFAAEQVRQTRHQRSMTTAAELMRAVQDADFTDAMALIMSLPENCSAEELRSRGDAYVRAAMLIAIRFETIGLYVYRNVMPLALVAQLCGGTVTTLWLRMAGWAEAVRAEQQQENWVEWYQWLAERCEERGRRTAVPAYKRYRDWQPESER